LQGAAQKFVFALGRAINDFAFVKKAAVCLPVDARDRFPERCFSASGLSNDRDDVTALNA